MAGVAQWYRSNPSLQRAEIEAMHKFRPELRHSYLPNGNMYWEAQLTPEICGSSRSWNLLLVYDPDHPKQRWGGSVKVYPVRPNIEEMQQLLKAAAVKPKIIPHLLEDDYKNLYLCTAHYSYINKDNTITSAATCLRYAIRWINFFELGLLDQETWADFQKHNKI